MWAIGANKKDVVNNEINVVPMRVQTNVWRPFTGSKYENYSLNLLVNQNQTTRV